MPFDPVSSTSGDSEASLKSEPNNPAYNHPTLATIPEAERRISRLDPNLVWFRKDDPENPYAWPLWKKWMIVFIMCLNIFWIAGAGSIYAPAQGAIAAEFGISRLVSRIPIATYLIGFAFGPVLLSPLAEDYGRKWVFLGCMIVVYLLQIPCALANNISTLIVVRFFAGFFASPIFNSCACVPDLFRADDPLGGWTLNFWALSAESVVINPIFGAYILHKHHENWRIIFWVIMGVGFGLTALYGVLVPETRNGVLLVRKAKKMRKETGNSKLFAEHELVGHRTISQILKETLYRPVYMLFAEPIVFYFALYDGLNYGIIYLAIEAIPIIYTTQHGLQEPTVQFTFFSIYLGYLIAIFLYRYQLALSSKADRKLGHVDPEAKLLWAFLAAVLFPVSLYGFAWTTLPQVHWAVSLIFLAMFGIASHILFVAVSDYTVDSYVHLASSAVAGQSFAREQLSAALVVVGENFFTASFGPQVATTILAGFATVLGVLPFLFYYYGPQIRARSSFSLEIKKATAEEMKREQEEFAMEKATREYDRQHSVSV